MELHLLDRVVGVTREEKINEIKTSEPLMLNIGTATTVGVVTSARKNEAQVSLKASDQCSHRVKGCYQQEN